MYALAHNLVGFRSSTLRVKVEREEPGYVFVRTADLLDAGTPLALDPSQVEVESVGAGAIRHRGGLVAMEG